MCAQWAFHSTDYIWFFASLVGEAPSTWPFPPQAATKQTAVKCKRKSKVQLCRWTKGALLDPHPNKYRPVKLEHSLHSMHLTCSSSYFLAACSPILGLSPLGSNVRTATQHKHISPVIAVNSRWGSGCCMKNCRLRNQVEADKKSHYTSQYFLAYKKYLLVVFSLLFHPQPHFSFKTCCNH